ncbi:citrate lyase beta subunit [Rickenella mellea]|uniref:Citrate lyase beta subunit n=1 Tax=Rickenella mellea TaxID=50990 RepID=A0A4Y7Q778_9AGAM|nr:citrate lyase beta subunit [Rickenella mellea]
MFQAQCTRALPRLRSNICAKRYLSAGAATDSSQTTLRRSYLYVPSSSERMLQKSLVSGSDTIIYDLEDSVAPSQKETARKGLVQFLNGKHADALPHPERIAVRVNAIDTPYFREDIAAVVQTPAIRSIVMPKIHSAENLDAVAREVVHASRLASIHERDQPLRFIASIESARGFWGVGDIAKWKAESGVGALSALLFAAEDYCADTSILRTPSRQELLYTRSRIAAASKAFGLEAIDMVCINYKDTDYLREECEDGRRLGYNGKQAIHPSQVDIIQQTFLPSEKEILRAAKIVQYMERSHQSNLGAFGLEMSDGKGGKEMIDSPMLKQAENIIRIAKAAGIKIPSIE